LRDAVYDSITDLIFQTLRLSLRLGDKHEIVEAHRGYVAAYTVRHETVLACDTGSPLSEQDEARMGEMSDTTNERAMFFIKTCEEWFERG
jgi:hypothetical protein